MRFLTLLFAVAAHAYIALRAADGSCSISSPCSNGACCSVNGYCGYGPDFCGDGTTPNSKCISNCGAHADCGQFAKTPGAKCPLNVCCGQYGFCGTTDDFCGTGCQSGCKVPSSGKSNGDVQKRIIGYYESWIMGKRCAGMDPNQIPVQVLTHLNFAFAFVKPGTYEVVPMPGGDPKAFQQITDLKRKNGALMVGVSIGGWTFNDNGTDTQKVFSDIVSTSAKRATFIANVMKFIDHYGFDAVDLDWEYPGAPDRGGRDGDTDGYVLLVQELKSQMKRSSRKLELSFTAPSSYWYLRWFKIGEMSAAVDYINFMTYDLHGTWDASTSIGAKMYGHTNLTEIDAALDLLWRNGVAPDKVNLGLGFYARTYTIENQACLTPGCPFKAGGHPGACTDTSGILSYREITEVLAQNTKIVPVYDEKAGVKYFNWDRTQWASYDDEETFQAKIKFGNTRGLGGLLIWAIDQDTPNLDALRGVIAPKSLTVENPASDVDYWNDKLPGFCSATPCGGHCGPGTVEVTKVPCLLNGNQDSSARLCCPIQSAPDPKSCKWRGMGAFAYCDGGCAGGEVPLLSVTNTFENGNCDDGHQLFCCPVPEVADGAGINCGWQPNGCRDDQYMLTFAGNVYQTGKTPPGDHELRGQDLADWTQGKSNINKYCCGKEEANNWQDCRWVGTQNKGVYNCDDAHCAINEEVQLTDSPYGYGGDCTPSLRSKAFCCKPASGKSLFLPVPLENLFPKPPASNLAEPIFNLETDDTWGTGKDEGSKDDPNASSFGFVVLTAPDEVHISLRRRSPWETFNCSHTDSEEPQTMQMLCAGDEEHCAHIHRGYGAVGTILEMPDRCGPGRYAVVKEMAVARNQSVPDHLRRRGLHDKTVYDLTFDYDFRRVPRAFGDSQVRIDFSNEEDYWDSVVERPGDKKKRSDSEMTEFRRNRRRWLEDEWHDAKNSLSHEELHKRWFGSSVLAWLAKLVGVSKVEANKNLHHTVDETLSVILVDQQFGPCPVGPALAAGSLKATLNAHLKVDTNFGLTIIATLDDSSTGISLQDSYLYFKNQGEVTVSFKLDAVATLSYTSGNVKLIGLDNFPGATFRVPGIVTVGPNMEIFGRVDAQLTFAGHIEAKATIASWNVQQTYPQNKDYPAQTLGGDPNQSGTSETGPPKFDASVSVNGEVGLHLLPKVTFGIVFDKRWKVPDTSASLNLDGYVIFHASARYDLNGDNSCPFRYGIDAGANLWAQVNAPDLFGWGDSRQFPLGQLNRVAVVPDQCVGGGSLTRRESLAYSYDNGSYTQFNDLVRRDTYSVGPIITLPDSFLNCPTPGGKLQNCPLCGLGTPSGTKRDDSDTGASCELIEPPLNGFCSSSLTKRANSQKSITLPWGSYANFVTYPSCTAAGAPGVPGWYLGTFQQVSVDPRPCDPTVLQAKKEDNGLIKGVDPTKFAAEHIFEVSLLSDFIYWLIGQNVRQYAAGPIPWLGDGWQRPDKAWLQEVFGVNNNNGGFQFKGDPNGPAKNFLKNAADLAFGSTSNPDLMVLLKADLNSAKRWLTENSPRLNRLPTGYASILKRVQLMAGVFDYLHHDEVLLAWVKSGQRMEQICVQFDNAWWADDVSQVSAGLKGTRFLRPATGPNGATNWGLRTVWNYWLEQHLFRIDDALPEVIRIMKDGLTTIVNDQSKSATERQQAQAFRDTIMGDSGVAGRILMHYPRDDSAWLLGLKTKTTRSRYGLWDGQRYGLVGV